MPKKNRKAFIYSRTDRSKVAEPDISAGLLFQAPYLSTGYSDLKMVRHAVERKFRLASNAGM